VLVWDINCVEGPIFIAGLMSLRGLLPIIHP